MTGKGRKILVLLLCVLMAAAWMMPAALAAGKIETGRAAELEIRYQDGETPVADAYFRAYKVADTDEDAHMTLTGPFEVYRDSIDGLSSLEDMTADGWNTLAGNLRGYVLRDGLMPTAKGSTDSEGNLLFDRLETGLYLVIGEQTAVNHYTYSAMPFMVFLPDRDETGREWVYEVTAKPKFTKDTLPPEGEHVSRKVLKVWKDEGCKTLRPTEISVQLLRDGKVFDTVTLNAKNNWEYTWEKLEAGHEWLVTEDVPLGYKVSIEQNGITIIMTNTIVSPITDGDLPVLKRISGHKPEKDSRFVFVMKAGDESFPMPEGSEGAEKKVTITGVGIADFGKITFEKPGTYTYTVCEEKGTEAGYTYDRTVYTVTYDVTLKDGKITAVRRIVNSDGKETNLLEFTNPYKPPYLPQTGMLWWPVPILLCAGLVLVLAGIIRRRADV